MSWLSFKKHSHKWGKIEGGYQYCIECGLARAAPCNHKWVEIGEIQRSFFGNVNGITQILKCQKCGELKNFELGK